jgi:hypothetical protein
MAYWDVLFHAELLQPLRFVHCQPIDGPFGHMTLHNLDHHEQYSAISRPEPSSSIICFSSERFIPICHDIQ